MLGNNSPNFDGNVFYISVKNMKKGENNDPYLQAATYDPKTRKYPAMEDQYTKMEGFLKKITLSSFEYQGNTIEKVDFVLEDVDQNGVASQYRFSMALGGASRELLNKMASIATKGKFTEKLTIGVYKAEDFKHPETGDAMELRGMWVHNGGEKVAKAYPYEKLKSMVTTVEVGGKKINDFTELDNFYKKLVVDILVPAIPSLEEELFPDNPGEVAETPADMKKPNIYADPEKPEAEASEADDLPF